MSVRPTGTRAPSKKDCMMAMQMSGAKTTQRIVNRRANLDEQIRPRFTGVRRIRVGLLCFAIIAAALALVVINVSTLRAQGSRRDDIVFGPSGQFRLRLDRGSYQRLCHQVLRRDGSQFQRCGRSENLQVHHIQPRSHLKGDVEENLITLAVPAIVGSTSGPRVLRCWSAVQTNSTPLGR
jgi:hypothetical protein